jgi:cellulose synthase/poly-beta-1,6-N-acetylglucosamine synthase-like glycosyltransferase
MSDFTQWLLAPLNSAYIHSGLSSGITLIWSSKLLFWYLILVFLRYEFPDFALYAGYLLRRSKFEPESPSPVLARKPLVSVLIAGRNPGYSIVTCIQSVLNGTYQNVEIIFADDHSTDNSVELARTFEGTGRVRVCENANHSGKPANLNVALMLARGEFIFVLDSDSQVFPDTIEKMLPYFDDPQVGAVSPIILVRNGTASIMTAFQRIEYVMTYALNQLWRDRLGIMMILPGMGTLFRGAAMRGLGGYDMGLGDDTDITIRLRKAQWKLRTALRGRISTDVPVTLAHLIKQRSRWTRNMVKMRIRKHRDMGSFRYGTVNALAFYEVVFNRVVHPLSIIALLIFTHLMHGFDAPILIGSLYWFSTGLLALKFFIGKDMTHGEPGMWSFLLVPFYFLYRVPLLLVQVVNVTRELFMIAPWHPYVPRRIWNEIPHH